MIKQLRPLALFACITATTALGAHVAAAHGPASDAPAMKGGEQHHKGERGHRGQHFFRKLARELGLNEQQKTQAKALLERSRADNKPYFAAVMTERHQMRTLMLSGADEAAIRAQSAKVGAAQTELAVQRAKEARELMALLTPDQVAKLKTILEKRDQRFKDAISWEEAPQ